MKKSPDISKEKLLKLRDEFGLDNSENFDVKLDTRSKAPFGYDEDGQAIAPFGHREDGSVLTPYGTRSDGKPKIPFGVGEDGLPIVEHGWHDDHERGARWRRAKGLGLDPDREKKRNSVRPNARVSRELHERFEAEVAERGTINSRALEEAITDWTEVPEALRERFKIKAQEGGVVYGEALRQALENWLDDGPK